MKDKKKKYTIASLWLRRKGLRGITDRKKVEEELRILSSAVEQAIDGIAIYDLEPKLRYVNNAFARMHGYSPEEMIEMNAKNLHDEERMEEYRRGINQVKTQGSWMGETRHLKKDGIPFPAYMSVTLLKDEKAKPIGIISVCRDITERKRAEKELKKYTKELERANRDLEDFTSRVSHDLKAPLLTIQSFTMFLMEDYADTLDETGREYLDKVKEAAKRMSVQIEDLLKLSRVGRKFIDMETVDLNVLLEEIKSDLSARIDERGGEVVVGKLPHVSTQRVWMKELFTNLIDNGLKFNKSEKPGVEVSCEEDGKNYQFKVKDNGIGLEEKYQAKIFNLFETLHSQSDYEGTGAGLAICKKIVEELGGAIWVESKTGEGSTFFFTIPRNCSHNQ
jgi:PAS domain S-box-containing protein